MNNYKRLSLLASCVAVALSAHTNVNAEEYAEEFDGEQVVVSGSRIEQSLEDVAGSVAVITNEQIETRLVTDLESMFRYDPSITTTGSGAQPQTLRVRGIGGNRLVYIKDGRRINDSYAGGGGFLVGRGYFDTDNVQQLEVAKGAASSLYGSDGLGGIVVINTMDPDDYLGGADSHFAIRAGYEGASEQFKFGFDAAQQIGDWQLSAAYTRRDGHEVQNFDENLPGYDATSDALIIKAQTQLDQTRTLKITLDWFSQELEQIIDPQANEVINEDSQYAVSMDYSSDNATAFWDSWQGQLYFSRYEQDSDQIVPSTRGYTDFNDYSFDQDILGLRALFNKQIETKVTTHQLVYGWDYDSFDTERPRIKTRILADGSIDFSNQPQRTFPGSDTLLTGIFIQDNIDVKDSNWSLVLGLRADYYELQPNDDPLYADADFRDIDETALSPKFGAIYKFNQVYSIYGQYVQGFKIPPHDQAFQSHGVEPFYQILPNADLDPEESEVWELGLRGSSDDFQFQLSAFYGDFENFIETGVVGVQPTFIPGVTRTIFQYQNLDNANIYGAEFSSTYYVSDDINIQFNLAYTKGENDETDQPLNTISPMQGSAIAEWDLDSWRLTAALRFARDMNDVPDDDMGQPLITSAGYAVLDVFAHYEWDNWQLNMGIDNLLDKEYVPYEAIAGQPADLNLNQFTQPGRNFSATLVYQF